MMVDMKINDRVHVPGRYNRLIVRSLVRGVHEPEVFAEFKSGFGFYQGPVREFADGWLREHDCATAGCTPTFCDARDLT